MNDIDGFKYAILFDRSMTYAITGGILMSCRYEVIKLTADISDMKDSLLLIRNHEQQMRMQMYINIIAKRHLLLKDCICCTFGCNSCCTKQ